MLVEDQRHLATQILGPLVVPDLSRPELDALDEYASRGNPVEQQNAGAIFSQIAKERLRLADPRQPAFLQLVARRLRVGVAAAPEPFDEGIALVVLLGAPAVSFADPTLYTVDDLTPFSGLGIAGTIHPLSDAAAATLDFTDSASCSALGEPRLFVVKEPAGGLRAVWTQAPGPVETYNLYPGDL